MKDRKTPRLWETLPWIWLVAAWLGAVAFTALWGRTYLDSFMRTIDFRVVTGAQNEENQNLNQKFIAE